MGWLERGFIGVLVLTAWGCADLVEGQAGGTESGSAETDPAGTTLPATSETAAGTTAGTTGDASTTGSTSGGPATSSQSTEGSTTAPDVTATTRTESSTVGDTLASTGSESTAGSSSESSSSGGPECTNEDEESGDEPLASQTCDGMPAVAFDGMLDVGDTEDRYAFDLIWTANPCTQTNPHIVASVPGTTVCVTYVCAVGTEAVSCDVGTPTAGGDGCCGPDDVDVYVDCDMSNGTESVAATITVSRETARSCFDYNGTVDVPAV